MRMQVILDSPFARPGSAPMWGAGRKESSRTGLSNNKKPYKVRNENIQRYVSVKFRDFTPAFMKIT